MRYFLSLGSNVGDRMKNLNEALFLLKNEAVELVKASSVYETQPIGIISNLWFFNQVIEVEADFSPRAFLAVIKTIEKRMGREVSIRNAPRIIDIDILLAGKTVINTKEIAIPHPRMVKRNFVLIPLKEISPDTVHPLLKESIFKLWQKCKDISLVNKIMGADCLKSKKET